MTIKKDPRDHLAYGPYFVNLFECLLWAGPSARCSRYNSKHNEVAHMELNYNGGG